MKTLSNTHLEYLQEQPTYLHHKCKLNLEKPAAHKCLTSIIATISRNSRNLESLSDMLANGMQIARLNMSHHSHDYHSDTIRLLRVAMDRYDKMVGYKSGLAIALELRGPQIHTGFLECDEDIYIETGDRFRLSTNKDYFYKGNKHFIYVGYTNITNQVLPGHRVVLDDGEILLVTREVSGENLFCDVTKGGFLKNNKVIKFPDTNLDLPAVTEKDRFDLQFALEKNVDMIIAPQIRNAASVYEIRNILGRRASHMLIISKIEHKESMSNVDEIIDASDAILFPRADLCLEIPVVKLCTAQRAILAKCQKKGKPFVCANCVLKAMISKPEPTSSEVIELSSVISEGVDCILLTTATGVGPYPVEAVQKASRICKEAELATWHHGFYEAMIALDLQTADVNYTTAITTVIMAKTAFASGIIVLTTSGRTANLISRYKPRCPIFAVTRCEYTFRKEKLYRGVIPILYNSKVSNLEPTHWAGKFDARLEYALWVGNRMGFIRTSDSVIVVGPWRDSEGFTNNARLIYAFFENDFKPKKKTVKKKEEKPKPVNYCCNRCRF